MGSFSNAIAAFKEGRKFIGTELDEKWFKLGEKKLNDLMSQQTIF